MQKLSLEPVEPPKKKLDLVPLDLEPIETKKDTKAPSTFSSRVSENASGLGAFIASIMQAAVNPSKITESGVEMLRGPIDELTNTKNSIPARGVRAVTRGLGFDPDAITEDFSSGNYGAWVGDLAVPLGVGAILHKMGTRGEARPEVLPAERVTRMLKEGARTALPDVEIPQTGPRLLKAGVLDLEPIETSTGPKLLKAAPASEPVIPEAQKLLTAAPERLQIPETSSVIPNDPRFVGTLEGTQNLDLQFPHDFTELAKNRPDVLANKLAYPEGGQIVNAPNIGELFDPRQIEPLTAGAFRNRATGINAPQVESIRTIDPDISRILRQENTPRGINAPYTEPVFSTVIEPDAARNIREELRRNTPPNAAGTVDKIPQSRSFVESITGNQSQNRALDIANFSELLSSEEGSFDPNFISNLLKKLPEVLNRNVQTRESSRFSSNLKYDPPPADTPAGKVLEAMRNLKPLRELQDETTSQERARRFRASESVNTSGEAGMYQRLGKLSGPIEKVTHEGIKLEQTHVDALADQITNAPVSEGLRSTARRGLIKILKGGEVPQPSEMQALSKIYGEGFTSSLSELYRKALGESGEANPSRLKTILLDNVNLPKAIKASMDVSAPFRQGLNFYDRKAFWTSFDDMFKAWGSQKAYDGILGAIKEDPFYKLANEYGLSITETKKNIGALGASEEAFASSLAHHVPGVLRSDRAYTAFLDSLRFDLFKDMLSDAQKAGLAPGKNPIIIKQIVKTINDGTGRGSLDFRTRGMKARKSSTLNFEKNAAELNTMFFSPRFISARVRSLNGMLNPMEYIKRFNESGNNFANKQYARQLIAVSGLTIGLTKLMQGVFGADVSDEPTASDFGKSRFGNVRLDPYGGYQQLITAAARVATGTRTSSKGNTVDLTGNKYGTGDTMDVVKDFIRSKLSPIGGLVWDLINRKTFDGKPIDYPTEAINTFIPMVVNDLYEMAKEDPKLIPTVGTASVFGMGSQTYNQDSMAKDIANLLKAWDLQMKNR